MPNGRTRRTSGDLGLAVHGAYDDREFEALRKARHRYVEVRASKGMIPRDSPRFLHPLNRTPALGAARLVPSQTRLF